MLADWIIDAGLPFSATDNKKLRKLMHYMRPEFKVPGRTTVSTQLIPELAAKVEQFV